MIKINQSKNLIFYFFLTLLYYFFFYSYTTFYYQHPHHLGTYNAAPVVVSVSVNTLHEPVNAISITLRKRMYNIHSCHLFAGVLIKTWPGSNLSNIGRTLYTNWFFFSIFVYRNIFSHYDFTEDLPYVCSCLIGFIFPAHTHNNKTRVCKFNKGRFLINSNEWHEDRTGDYGCLCCQTPTLWLTCLTHSYTVFLPGCSHLHSSPCTAMYTLACVSLLGSPFLARVCLHSPLM